MNPVVDIQELSRNASHSSFIKSDDISNPIEIVKRKLDEAMKTTKEILKQGASRRVPIRVEKKVVKAPVISPTKPVSRLGSTLNTRKPPPMIKKTVKEVAVPVKKQLTPSPTKRVMTSISAKKRLDTSPSPSLASEDNELSRSFSHLDTSVFKEEYGEFIEKTFRDYLKQTFNQDSRKIDANNRQELLDEYQKHLGLEIVKSLNIKLGKESKLEEEIEKARLEIEETRSERSSPVRLKPKLNL